MTGEGNRKNALQGRAVLVLVENLSVPFDRRVWQECTTLRAAGLDVTVVCPKGMTRDTELFEVREGIEIHRFPLPDASSSAFGYVREYALALWRIRSLVRRLSRGQRFDVVHVTNPPDLLFLATRRLQRRHGTRLVFDHHDLAPELYLSRFERGRDVLYRLLCTFERLSFGAADVVIATNESYRSIALTRGRKAPKDVFVVRNGPDLRQFVAREQDPTLKRGKPYLLAYVGVMGPQDGVDYALRALASLRLVRSDWHSVFVGDGDALPAMKELARELGIGEHVEFTGFVEPSDVLRVLSTADICLAPEPSNPLNNMSTMIKVAEYMALARPIVAFDLPETRATAGDAALYATPNDDVAFAQLIDELLSDNARRARLGDHGRARVEGELSWAHSAKHLVAAYEHVLQAERVQGSRASAQATETAAA